MDSLEPLELPAIDFAAIAARPATVPANRRALYCTRCHRRMSVVNGCRRCDELQRQRSQVPLMSREKAEELTEAYPDEELSGVRLDHADTLRLIHNVLARRGEPVHEDELDRILSHVTESLVRMALASLMLSGEISVTYADGEDGPTFQLSL